MDCHFFDDCGLEEYDYLYHEIDEVRSEYFPAGTVRNVEQIDIPQTDNDSEASDTADEMPTDSTASSVPGGNNEDTTSDQNSTDDDFISPIKSFLQSGCDCCYGKNQSSCTKSLDFDEVVEHRMQCIELSSIELDLVILGALQSREFLQSKKTTLDGLLFPRC